MSSRVLGCLVLVLAAACGDDDRAPSCETGEAACGSLCVDLNTNALNCGACGNSCAGTMCVSGTCATRDGGTDTGTSDTGLDVGMFDTGPEMMDTGTTDGGLDTGLDAGLDGGADAGTDAGTDAGRDAGTDSGPPDVGVDAGPPCALGRVCSAGVSCSVGSCIPAEAATIGGTADPIASFPGGGNSYATTFWVGGYCAELGTPTAPFACDPDDPADPVCGACGTCVDFGNQSACLQSCTPNFTDNSSCRDDYACDLGAEACLPAGCEPGIPTEPGCRVRRRDDNGVPGIQTPADCTAMPATCGGMASNFDSLFYDATSTATCDAATFRCVDTDRSVTASGGDMCTRDNQCEPRGFCIAASSGWPGGSCIKTRCDLPGNGCANDGVCQERGVSIAACLEGCTVGMGAVAATPTTWVGGGTTSRGGCRTGYGCWWNGTGLAGAADNGVCLPVDYNARSTSNVGASCTADADCYSPFGLGFCLTGGGFGGGYCSVRDCGAPFFSGATPPSVCGAGNACVTGLTPDDPSFALCLDSCTTATECRAGYGCVDMGGGTRACFACESALDCRSGETCNAATGVCS